MLGCPIDTLRADTALLARWKEVAAYQYQRELLTPEVNFWEWLQRWLGNWFEGFSGIRIDERWVEGILLLTAVFMVLFVVLIVYRRRLGLFVRSRKMEMAYRIEEDTIYGIDFVGMIQQALDTFQYREAVRWLYLQTLKELNEQECIDWQPYKTPTQYLYECQWPAFRQLTNEFLRVRYGHFEADEALFKHLQSLQKEILQLKESEKGGKK